jgi:hypothetical protein
MSIAEFENAVHVLGVKTLVELICQKWRSGHAGVPLSAYYSKVLNRERQRVKNVRNHIQTEDRELFLELGLSASMFGAQWPL